MILERQLYALATDKYSGPLFAPLKAGLYLLSLIYGLAAMVLYCLSRFCQKRLRCKVISVGNITLGGTGKTTLVKFIALYFVSRGKKVAVLTRGYRRGRGSSGSGKDGPADEPCMLRAALEGVPVIVDPDRARAARTAVRDHGVEVVILDDGMQQWGIKKDLEIVAINLSSPFGNRRLIPRGILRQPLFTLKDADIFFLSRAEPSFLSEGLDSQLRRLNPRAEIFYSVYRTSGFSRLSGSGGDIGQEGLQGRPAVIFSGIADPDYFQSLVENAGVKVLRHIKFTDHHPYSAGELEDIIGEARSRGAEILITTEKDAVRLRGLLGQPRITDSAAGETSPLRGGHEPQILYLRIALKITENEEGFSRRLAGVCGL